MLITLDNLNRLHATAHNTFASTSILLQMYKNPNMRIPTFLSCTFDAGTTQAPHPIKQNSEVLVALFASITPHYQADNVILTHASYCTVTVKFIP